MTLESRLEYLARAIMSAKSCNLRTAGSGEGEFLHELEEKLEVARIQMQVYQALVNLRAVNPSRRVAQALAALDSRLLDVTTVRMIKLCVVFVFVFFISPLHDLITVLLKISTVKGKWKGHNIVN